MMRLAAGCSFSGGLRGQWINDGVTIAEVFNEGLIMACLRGFFSIVERIKYECMIDQCSIDGRDYGIRSRFCTCIVAFDRLDLILKMKLTCEIPFVHSYTHTYIRHGYLMF